MCVLDTPRIQQSDYKNAVIRSEDIHPTDDAGWKNNHPILPLSEWQKTAVVFRKRGDYLTNQLVALLEADREAVLGGSTVGTYPSPSVLVSV